MEIFYCDGCGSRISGEPVRVGSGETESLYCPNCAPKHTPVATSATPSGGMARRSTVKKAPTSGSNIRAATGKTSAVGPTSQVKRATTARAALPQSRPAPKEKSSGELYLVIGIGVFVLGLIAFFMLRGNSNDTGAKDDSKNTSSEKSAPSATPSHMPPSPPPPPHPSTNPSPSPTKPPPPPPTPPLPAPGPAPAPGSKVLTSPLAAALMAIPTPPPDSPVWHNYNIGKDLSWLADFKKGKWSVENGELVADGTPSVFCWCDTTAQYGDVEVIVKLRSDAPYVGIQVRNMGFCGLFKGTSVETVHTFRVVVVGQEMAATLDGNPINAENEYDPKALPLEGPIRLYTTQGSISYFKEVRVREIKPGEFKK